MIGGRGKERQARGSLARARACQMFVFAPSSPRESDKCRRRTVLPTPHSELTGAPRVGWQWSPLPWLQAVEYWKGVGGNAITFGKEGLPAQRLQAQVSPAKHHGERLSDLVVYLRVCGLVLFTVASPTPL